MYKLGNCYEYGRGIRKDEKKAFKFSLKSAKGGINLHYILKAAINDITNTQYKMVKYYKNKMKAFEWYLKLANKTNESNLRAIYLVAKCYRDDNIGTFCI
ncbi:hypothetical protein C1645_830016 [Glomus cerebriforme]|uniref:HCP-like protein n=1 Tax=Glomus cerebriforme TaxID=658196 RepID=A0A397SSV6_9GLOM|nr:hypothetical protein C1645_830016 [Glomus cerebriforme]